MEFRELLKRVWEKFSRPLQVAGWSAIVVIGTSGTLALTSSQPTYLTPRAIPATSVESAPPAPEVAHKTTPGEVRGLYMTSYTAASPKLRNGIFEYAKRNDLNSVVIDIKDSGGALAFKPVRASLKSYAPARPTIPDLDAVLKEARDYGLYRIARLFVFQDPLYANTHPDQAVLNSNTGKVWTDFKGVSWVDPAAKGDWQYNAEVAREAYDRGFDEIQLDYIRFPSDGKLTSISYAKWDGNTPKAQIIGNFYGFMHKELVEKGIPLSLDLFGYVTWYRDFDLGIGQLMATGMPNANAISAMVYPSHYGAGALGFSNPAEHPYEIVKASMDKAGTFYADIKTACAAGAAEYVVSASGSPKIAVPCGKSLAGQRPWLQAFDLGAVYTKEMINAQIKAARDGGATGWLLWNARNVYRDIK